MPPEIFPPPYKLPCASSGPPSACPHPHLLQLLPCLLSLQAGLGNSPEAPLRKLVCQYSGCIYLLVYNISPYVAQTGYIFSQYLHSSYTFILSLELLYLFILWCNVLPCLCDIPVPCECWLFFSDIVTILWVCSLDGEVPDNFRLWLQVKSSLGMVLLTLPKDMWC